MNDYLATSYKGVYCSICNAEVNEYFDVENKRFQISEKFCRNLIKESILPLSYFHNFLIKVANLAAKFVTTCNYKGVFTDSAYDPKFIMHSIKTYRRKITKCLKNVNTGKWLLSCESVCKEFSFIKFNKFFSPNMMKFKTYTNFLKEKIRFILKEK